MTIPKYPFLVRVRRVVAGPGSGRVEEVKSFETLPVAISVAADYQRKPATTSVQVLAVLHEWTKNGPE